MAYTKLIICTGRITVFTTNIRTVAHNVPVFVICADRVICCDVFLAFVGLVYNSDEVKLSDDEHKSSVD